MLNGMVFAALLLGSCFYVLLRGGAPERIALIACLAASVVTAFADGLDGLFFNNVEVLVIVIDLLLLLAFMFIALRADRYWPLWIAGFHMVGVMSHLALLLDPRIGAWGYAVGQAFWSYPILFIIIAGAFRHQARLKRNGIDKAWSNSFTIFRKRTPQPG